MAVTARNSGAQGALRDETDEVLDIVVCVQICKPTRLYIQNQACPSYWSFPEKTTKIRKFALRISISVRHTLRTMFCMFASVHIEASFAPIMHLSLIHI